MNEKITAQAIAAIDPSHAFIKQEIPANIEKMKKEVKDKEALIDELAFEGDYDRKHFINDMGKRLLDLTHDERELCKQIVFPAGFWVNDKYKVYTPGISPLVRLATNKKISPEPEESSMVRVKRL